MDPFLDLIDTGWLLNSKFIRNLTISVLVILFLVIARWLIMRAVKSQTNDIALLLGESITGARKGPILLPDQVPDLRPAKLQIQPHRTNR